MKAITMQQPLPPAAVNRSFILLTFGGNTCVSFKLGSVYTSETRRQKYSGCRREPLKAALILNRIPLPTPTPICIM